MIDEREIKMIARGIKNQLERMDKKMSAYMEAKLHLELCETNKEKLIYIKSAMEKIDDV